jgi:MFS transporter, DHA1 family, multidrug resistance protein
MGCVGLLMGSLGMTLISLNWANTIIALGAMMVTTATLSLVFWPIVIKHAQQLPGPAPVEVAF